MKRRVTSTISGASAPAPTMIRNEVSSVVDRAEASHGDAVASVDRGTLGGGRRSISRR
jgi:hypothetical protein